MRRTEPAKIVETIRSPTHYICEGIGAIDADVSMAVTQDYAEWPK